MSQKRDIHAALSELARAGDLEALRRILAGAEHIAAIRQAEAIMVDGWSAGHFAESPPSKLA